LQISERAVAEDDAHDRLAVAGARHAADRAVGVGAAADEGAVPDAPGELARSSAGRRGRRDGAVAVEGDRAHRAAASCGGLARELGVTFSLPVGDERGGVALRDSDGAGEREGALADQQNLAARLEEAPPGGDRIRDARA